jgi:hypothetical protein
MEQRIEQLEKTVHLLQEEIAALKVLLAGGFTKIESNFKDTQMSIGLLKRAKLADEINKLNENTDAKSIKI